MTYPHSDIPLIDFSESIRDPWFLEKPINTSLCEEVRYALTHVGFMSVKNIGLDWSLVDKTFKLSKTFFSSSEQAKQNVVYRSAEENFGFQRLGVEALNPAGTSDLKETFTLRNPHNNEAARWPSESFRENILTFFDQCVRSASVIQRVIAHTLNLDKEFFVSRHSGENITMRLLHYPPNHDDIQGQLGAGAHTDYGLLTLLFQDETPGLEVFDTRVDEWVPVAPVPQTVVVNSGDLMERWTNGRYRSTRHRVQPQRYNQHRYSIAVFFDPDDDVLVESLASCVNEENPLQYPPITVADHLLEKIRATHNVPGNLNKKGDP